MRFNSNCRNFFCEPIEKETFGIESNLVPYGDCEDLYIDAINRVNLYEAELSKLKAEQSFSEDDGHVMDLEFDRCIATGVMQCIGEVIWEDPIKDVAKTVYPALPQSVIDEGLLAAENYANQSHQV